ncbi:MAG TPA: sugar-binding protein [Pirellulales bacterium]|jgi:ribose transport system substrate-binding protein|nr:sugar-binding protein [Pirellulales bacterium]
MRVIHGRLLFTLAALALLAGGCNSESNASKSGTANSADKKLTLAFVTNNAAPFWKIAEAGCRDAEKELGNVTVDVRFPSTGDTAAQQQILNDLVSAGVNGITVSPIDPPNQTDFLNNIAAQTLLTCVDSDAAESKRVCYIGTDNFAAGVEAGKLIKEVLPNGGKLVMFVGYLDAQNAKDRMGGIKKELEGSKVQILEVRTDDGDHTRALKNAEDILVKNPDIDCLVGLYSYNGPAILSAVREANKNGKVKIVCFDEDDATLEGVATGDIYGTVVQQPYEFGKQAITKMSKYLRGDKDALAGGKQYIATQDIKKDNVADFQAKLKAIIGK